MDVRHHRAVILPEQLFVVPRAPDLVAPGPRGAVLASSFAAGAVLADLEGDGRDLTVIALAADEAPLQATVPRLARWAALVGYERLWSPGALASLEPAACPLGEVVMRCGICRTALRDWTPGFWAMVRARRLFPDRCTVCGGALAQPEHVAGAAVPETAVLSHVRDENAW